MFCKNYFLHHDLSKKGIRDLNSIDEGFFDYNGTQLYRNFDR